MAQPSAAAQALQHSSGVMASTVRKSPWNELPFSRVDEHTPSPKMRPQQHAPSTANSQGIELHLSLGIVSESQGNEMHSPCYVYNRAPLASACSSELRSSWLVLLAMYVPILRCRLYLQAACSFTQEARVRGRPATASI